MIEIDPKRFRTEPFKHQLEGVKALVKNKSFALFDEMGAGKSKQVIDAACTLATDGEIDTVVIVTPASVRGVWIDAEFGEIKKHTWVDSVVVEYHVKPRVVWATCDSADARLHWVISNYEYMRTHWAELVAELVTRDIMLVLDESAFIKSRTSQQSKAIKKLRAACRRCVILNGTPVTKDPLDLWSQLDVLDPKILSDRYKNNYYYFRSEYCTMRPQQVRGVRFKQVIGYKNLEVLSGIVAPYVLRREKKDCLDLPPKLYTVREVPLAKESWERYQALRKDCIVELEKGVKDGRLQLEPNAGVRIMRLAQLTSGILGGRVSESEPEAGVLDLSDEKLDWATHYLVNECEARAVIVWTRWRRERERLAQALFEKHLFVWELYGGQPKRERDTAVAAFSPIRQYDGRRAVLLAQQQAGGFGLNLQIATEAIYLSNDFSLGARLQSEDRCHRPGQTSSVLYTDVLATGPEGERTIDHTIVKALRAKQDLSRLTCSEWRKELGE